MPANVFTKEEQARMTAGIAADFFAYAGQHGYDAAVQHIRSTYWEIETHATRLRRMAKGWVDTPDTNENIGFSAEAKKILNAAADELDRLTKMSVRRPISELRQEPWTGGAPDRWVLLWAPSGYKSSVWRCAVGRRSSTTHHQGDFVAHDNSCFTDGGVAPTHFSELPRDE